MFKVDNKSKGSITVIALLVVLLIVLLSGFLIERRFTLNQNSKNQIFVPVIVPNNDSLQATNSMFPDNTSLVYNNKIYKYQVAYSPSYKVNEDNNSAFGHTTFVQGCFNVYSIPEGNDFPSELNLSWKQFSEIQKLNLDGVFTSSTPNWRDQQGFTYEIKYKKLFSKLISGRDWTTLRVTNNWESYGDNYQYYLTKDSILYIIDIFSGGPCPQNESTKMLFTFKLL